MSAAMPLPDLPWLDAPLDAILRRRDTLPHALLLDGPPGVGKSALATQAAAALLCETPTAEGRACGHCLACGWFAQGNHPDLRRVSPIDEETAERSGAGVKASKDIRIQQIRELAGFVGVGTHRGGRRIVLLDPADALNLESANALLKTLEEPTPSTHFIVVARRRQTLPATIVSRCVRVDVAGPTPEQALAWLRRTRSLDAEGAELWLAAAGGSPLRAWSLADDEQGAVHRKTLEVLARLPETGVAASADVLALRPAAEWVEVMQAWVADLGRCRLGAPARRFVSQHARLERLARQAHPERLARFAGWLDQQSAVASHPLNARLFCERVLMQYEQIFAA